MKVLGKDFIETSPRDVHYERSVELTRAIIEKLNDMLAILDAGTGVTTSFNLEQLNNHYAELAKNLTKLDMFVEKYIEKLYNLTQEK
jgi:hypothetical protein